MFWTQTQLPNDFFYTSEVEDVQFITEVSEFRYIKHIYCEPQINSKQEKENDNDDPVYRTLNTLIDLGTSPPQSTH